VRLTAVSDSIRYLSTHDNSYQRYFSGHTAEVTCITMDPGKDEFLSCARDGTVRIWDLRSPSARGVLNIHGVCLGAYDPTGSVVAIASNSCHSVFLYDLRNFDKKPFGEFDMFKADKEKFNPYGNGANWTNLEFSNDGASILLGTSGNGHFVLDSYDGEVKHYLVSKPSVVKSPHVLSQRRPAGDRVDGAARERIRGQGNVSFAPDGRFVFGGTGDPDVAFNIWDTSEKSGATNNRLEPFAKVNYDPKVGEAAEIVQYNPRWNNLITADKTALFWLPDPELVMPNMPR
jgi:COMPASS component SWD2